MTSKKHLTRAALATVAAFSFAVFTATVSAKTKSHSAHEHGAARLTIASSEEGVEIALESPAANIFGFEYKPSSEADHATVDKLTDVLKSGEALFVVNDAAGCKQASVEVESAMIEDDEHDDHEKKAEDKHDDHDDHEKKAEDTHDDHDHDKKAEDKHDDHDKKAEDKHDDHDDHDKKAEDKHDDHDHDEKSGDTHNDVDVVWNFACENPTDIEQVEVKLHSAFPEGIEDLDVDWISATKSGHVELEADGVIVLK